MRALAVRSALAVGGAVFFIADIPKIHIDQMYSVLYKRSIKEDGMNEPFKDMPIISIATNLPDPLLALAEPDFLALELPS